VYLWFIGLLLCGVALLSLSRRGFRQREAQKGEGHLPEVHWVDAAASPLHRRVLDCRGYCRLQRVDTTDAKILEGFRRMQESSVQPLTGQLPQGADPAGHPVHWPLGFAQVPALLTSCMPATLEDKWTIRHSEGRLYFQRSWTGKLIYVAEIQVDPATETGGEPGATVTRVWLRDGEARSEEQRDLAIALCRYLIDSHLLGVPAAVPVPVDLSAEPHKMAVFAFSMAGRRGDYAEPISAIATGAPP
jgi:hypothetical protein